MKRILFLCMLAQVNVTFCMHKVVDGGCKLLRLSGLCYLSIKSIINGRRADNRLSEEKAEIVYKKDLEIIQKDVEILRAIDKYFLLNIYSIVKIKNKDVPIFLDPRTDSPITMKCRIDYYTGASMSPYYMVAPCSSCLLFQKNDYEDKGIDIENYKMYLKDFVEKNPIEEYYSLSKEEQEYKFHIGESWINQVANEALCSTLTKSEIEATLQHEQVHGEKPMGELNRDLKSLALAMPIYVLDKKLFNYIDKNTLVPFRSMASFGTKIVASGLLSVCYMNIMKISFAQLSRYEEYEADDAVEKKLIPSFLSYFDKYLYTRQIIKNELKKIHNSNLNNNKPIAQINLFSWIKKRKEAIHSYLFSTHPTDQQRIARLKKRLAKEN